MLAEESKTPKMNIETQLQSLTLNSIAELKEMKDQSA